MINNKVYVFNAALKHRKGIWRRIEIKDDQTLGDLDSIMRQAFNHDDYHLGEFFSGRVWKSESLGEIESDGSGAGAKKKIDELKLVEGNTIEYVYDFGDDIQHVIKLERIVDTVAGAKYPRVTSKNKIRNRYCVSCKKIQKKTIATWICIDCSEEEQKQVLLCEDCLGEEHEDHYGEELLL
ncbi:MAG: hypothetical protein Q8J68_01265 [Methanolobus sp.]|uniref:IS1096 element passenger TnpR family protein n=1 Tax=Methanolobus sp. TaxID=1874737 RepID=UPI00273209FC|nr:hypothetical protein [Methanolobus sp.]MDP2215911.1 hypothetical protein [Methanolobus sp.]